MDTFINVYVSTYIRKYTFIKEVNQSNTQHTHISGITT